MTMTGITAALAGWFMLLSPLVPAFDLSGTPFESAARRHQLDPLLLYAVALCESGYGGSRGVRPWAWALRSPEGQSVYARSQVDAEQVLRDWRHRYGNRIDIGALQVSGRYHHDKVNDLSELLNLDQNVRVGARILSDALKSAPESLFLGIGRYHSWIDRERADRYARRVLAIYRQLQQETL